VPVLGASPADTQAHERGPNGLPRHPLRREPLFKAALCSADARRLAAAVLGEISGTRQLRVQTRLIATATRALLAARPLLDELERGGLKVDRTRHARGFARRLEEAVSELPGAPILGSILHQLAGSAEGEPARDKSPVESTYND